jgi:hypothetical protein
MELRKDISRFITQIYEKNYSSANLTLETLIEKKLKAKVKKMHKDCCEPCAKKKNKKVVKENLDEISSSPAEPQLTNSNGDMSSNGVSDADDVSQGNEQDISDVPMVPLKNLPRGEYFKRKPDSNKVWIKGEYDKFMKKFLCGAFDDISQGMYLKPTTPVYVEFEF